MGADAAAVDAAGQAVHADRLPHDEPYFVTVDVNGCERCGPGKLWSVVGPDGDAIGQSFEDEELAADIADYMNQGYRAGCGDGGDDVPDDDGSYLWERCYACGHRLALASDGCPQCGIHFDGREDPEQWPETCECERCTEARASEQSK